MFSFCCIPEILYTFPPFIALAVIQKLLYNGNNEAPQRPLHDYTSNFHQLQSEPSSSIL